MEVTFSIISVIQNEEEEAELKAHQVDQKREREKILMKGMKNYKRKQITNVYPLPMHMLEQLKDMGTVIKETNINISAINNGQLM